MSSNDSSSEVHIQRKHLSILSDTSQTSYLVTAEKMQYLHFEVKCRPESGWNFPNQEFWFLEVIVVLTSSTDSQKWYHVLVCTRFMTMYANLDFFLGGGGGSPEICDPKNKILYRRGVVCWNFGIQKFYSIWSGNKVLAAPWILLWKIYSALEIFRAWHPLTPADMYPNTRPGW